MKEDGKRGVIAVAAVTLVFGVAVGAWSQAGPPKDRRTPAWVAPIEAVDHAVARQDARGAERASQVAYLAALGSAQWEGMVAAGDAYLRAGEVGGRRKDAEAKARRVYLTALFRARQQGSLDGVLRVAETFADLGDREVTEHCLHVAHSLVRSSGDVDAQARLTATQTRLAAEL
jgi:hypothetical protein